MFNYLIGSNKINNLFFIKDFVNKKNIINIGDTVEWFDPIFEINHINKILEIKKSNKSIKEICVSNKDFCLILDKNISIDGSLFLRKIF